MSQQTQRKIQKKDHVQVNVPGLIPKRFVYGLSPMMGPVAELVPKALAGKPSPATPSLSLMALAPVPIHEYTLDDYAVVGQPTSAEDHAAASNASPQFYGTLTADELPMSGLSLSCTVPSSSLGAAGTTYSPQVVHFTQAELDAIPVLTLSADHQLMFSLSQEAQDAQPDVWKVLCIEKATLEQCNATARFLDKVRYFDFTSEQPSVFYEKCPGLLKAKDLVFWSPEIFTICGTFVPYADGPITLYRNNKKYTSEYIVRGNPVSFTTKDLLTFLHFIERSPEICQYLSYDDNLMTSDMVLIAIAFLYLKGAEVEMEKLSLQDFFSALWLANIVYEDEISPIVQEYIDQSFMLNAAPQSPTSCYLDINAGCDELLWKLKVWTGVPPSDIVKLSLLIPSHNVWLRKR